MPGRKIPLVTGEIYHVLNRGVASQPTFLSAREYQHALDLIFYYRNASPPLKYSRFRILAPEIRAAILQKLQNQKQFLVEIIAYCLMPNHFHLILKQIADEGISKFASDFTNSYTRYFNTRHERKGPLFQGKFKAVRVETEEQLLHLSRYAHLNPYTSHVVKKLEDLKEYPYSSFPQHLKRVKDDVCQTDLVLSHFKSPAAYQKFVFDQADYQKRLEEIKYLALETP